MKAFFFDRLRYGKQLGYETLFKTQPKTASGKPGVIIAEMGLPEDYDLKFYSHFMEHVFNYILPPFLKPMILADKGIGLLDPENPLAREKFTPKQLIDANGSFMNKAGIPYTQCEVEWKPPANLKNEWDHGYFLYKGDGANGIPDVCDKVGAKIVGWYYGKLLPEKKVPWHTQLRKVYEDALVQLKERYPNAEFRNALYMYPDTVRKAVDELIEAGCETIVYQNINCPLYTDFEDYGYCLPLVHDAVNRRAKIIMADQLGNQSKMREAYCQILRDQLADIPNEASVLVILSRHGHPFKKETQDVRAHHYREPLEKDVRSILSTRGGKGHIIWSFDEYADKYWDSKNKKMDTKDAYTEGIRDGFDYIIELPTEFPAENTDLMIFHAMKKFGAFKEYDMNQPVSYPDWEQPLVRKFKEGRTTGIYAGCPVGKYRKYVVGALVDSISDVLK
jgi:hypothetical protein